MLCLRAAALAGVLFAMLVPTQADAAVRVCRAGVASHADAASEAEAKRRALAAWAAKVRVLGNSYTSWRIAAEKHLSCSRMPGGFNCAASARPCEIWQKPPEPGTLPRTRGIEA